MNSGGLRGMLRGGRGMLRGRMRGMRGLRRGLPINTENDYDEESK